MIRNIYLFAVALLFISCNENRLYEKHSDPSGNLEWNKSESITFDIEINDISIKYNVILALRFATGFAYPKCPVVITETSPSGESVDFTHEFITMSSSGYLGEVSGDIYDIEDLWRSSYTFPEAGIYHYEIRHELPEDKVHMVMEVGMIVDILEKK